MKKTIILSVMTSLIMNAANAQDKTVDQQAIGQVVATMEKGWNEKSGKTFASPFAAGHDYVVVNGLYLTNVSPEGNAMAHQNLFNGVYKTKDLRLKLDKIRFVREDLAMAHVLGATYEHGTAVPKNPAVVISMLLEKKNNEWKVISFHNCDIEISFEPGAQNGTQMPLEVMYAGWYKN